jgi:beta-galactosidase
MKKIFFIILVLFCSSGELFAQQSIKLSLNSNWLFHKGEIKKTNDNPEKPDEWENINLPHTWNAQDVSDDVPGYYRGVGWYRKTFFLPSDYKQTKSVYLNFQGVNQEADIYVNGQLAYKHIGGYTAFTFCINDFLKSDTGENVNEISVKVNNSYNKNIPPLNADFSFYGGIYRDVFLLTTNKIHFDLGTLGSSGICVRTPQVNSKEGIVEIVTKIANQSEKVSSFILLTQLIDADNKVLKQVYKNVVVNGGEKTVCTDTFKIIKPSLWSPDHPNLYRVISKLLVKDSKSVIDVENTYFGMRWFKFSADSGFFLNGRPMKLLGANRHQDYEGLGNALPNALHENDIKSLKAMGANFIRISHYPQDPAILQACDRLGILASVEIPIVNKINESPIFTENALHMQKEMISQNFNHPSVIIWGYMNEPFLEKVYPEGSPEQARYYQNMVTLAKKLDSLSHKEDNSRYTMISCHEEFDPYFKSGLAQVPQIVGWNLYFGWYEKGLQNLDIFLNKHHQLLPNKPMILTEYGADADSRLHNLNTSQSFDKTIEYQLKYHQYYLSRIKKLPYVSGAALWAFVDFNSERRQEATPHMNTKGVLTSKRETKETYYFYQANLLKTPFLQIGAETWKLRSGLADSKNECLQPVNVYSNRTQVELWNNGILLGTRAVDQGVATFMVPFKNGTNLLKAVVHGNKLVSFVAVDFKLLPRYLNNIAQPFSNLNVSLGDARTFVDPLTKEVWLPEQEYRTGSWGYVGGAVFGLNKDQRMPYGSSKIISGTANQSIFQTQRVGLSHFIFDVPNGSYEVTMHFAELLNSGVEQSLVYNLKTNNSTSETINRDFDIILNGQLIIKNLGNANYLHPLRAFSTSVKVIAYDGKGVDIQFKANSGESILNGIQIRKIY